MTLDELRARVAKGESERVEKDKWGVAHEDEFHHRLLIHVPSTGKKRMRIRPSEFMETPSVSQLTLQDIEPSLWRKLQQRAAAHGQSPEAEVKTILAQTLGCDPEKVWDKVDAIHDRLAASGRTFSDSAGLLREDRER